MKEIIELNNRLVGQLGKSSSEHVLMLGRDGQPEELKRLPVEFQAEIEAFRAKVNEVVPNDFDWALFLGDDWPDFTIEYNDGPQTGFSRGHEWQSGRCIIEQLKAFDWEAERHEAISGCQMFDDLRASAEDAPSRLLEHVVAFIADLRVRMRSDSHIKHLETRIKRLFVDCKWERLRDVSADSFQRWRANQKNFSPKTLNEYLNAASSLFSWMERNDRVESNPLRRVGKVERKGYERVKRRSFTDEEMERLLAASGLHALGYLFAVNTGLRRKELASLQWGDVHLNGEASFALVRSCTTKNRKAAKIYLRAQLVQILSEIKPAKVAGNESVLAGRIACMRKMHEHLKAAGIPVCNEQGYKVDFHALRMTYSTNLERVGGSLQVRQELLRHCDPRLTSGSYTDPTRLETAGLVEKLPDFSGGKNKYTQLGTQTTGATRHGVSLVGTMNGGAESSKEAENKGDCHSLSCAVTPCHGSSEEPVGGVRIPLSAILLSCFGAGQR
jgi:integrase